jgi:glutamate synthase domain-containing protein 3
MRVDAKGIPYKDLNERIREALDNGTKEIILDHVNGQRYIGDGLGGSNVKIIINGTPGNDLAAFMDGPTIVVNSNAQDGIGNTMNAGKIIVYGDAGDIVGHSMRGGKIYIKGDVGYRVGIHMKAYKGFYPVIIVGGTAGDFLGEYMAGGLLVILGITHDGIDKKAHPQGIVGDFVGTGMHGGRIFIRGGLDTRKVGKEVKTDQALDEDINILKMHLKDFCRYFELDLEKTLKTKFTKLYPYTHRPYGKIYAY